VNEKTQAKLLKWKLAPHVLRKVRLRVRGRGMRDSPELDGAGDCAESKANDNPNKEGKARHDSKNTG